MINCIDIKHIVNYFDIIKVTLVLGKLCCNEYINYVNGIKQVCDVR